MTDNFQVNWRSRIVKSGKILASQLTPHPNNPKYHPPSQREAIATSIDTYGQVAPVVVNLNNGYLVDGHERGWLAIAQSQDVEVDAIWVDITEQEHLQLLALYDHIGHMAGYEPELLDTLLQQVNSDDEVIQRLLSELAEGVGLYVDSGDTTDATEPRPSLSDRFVVPPFSVLDARQGYWQERKRRWLALGIQSEVGRGENLAHTGENSGSSTNSAYGYNSRIQNRVSPGGSLRDAATLVDGKTVRGDGVGKRIRGRLPADSGGQPLPLDRDKMKNGKSPARTFGQDLMRGEHTVGMGEPTGRAAANEGGSAWDGTWVKRVKGEDFTGLGANSSGTSIFDPVLCELAYRWFCPPDGLILDPFAGGSVRGIVASLLGRRYIGVDLRPEQVQANEGQAQHITPDSLPRWIVGDSRQLNEIAPDAYDFIFTCPPYFDLEIYSDDTQDLSNAGDYAAFLEDYRLIVQHACSMLNTNRFACVVVGDIRDKKGMYRNFVSDTIQAFLDCGLSLYNEAILVTSVGSLPIRVGKQFESGRKLGKTHQNVLVFVKGDPKAATAACGEIEVWLPESESGDSEYGEELIVP